MLEHACIQWMNHRRTRPVPQRMAGAGCGTQPRSQPAGCGQVVAGTMFFSDAGALIAT